MASVHNVNVNMLTMFSCVGLDPLTENRAKLRHDIMIQKDKNSKIEATNYSQWDKQAVLKSLV